MLRRATARNSPHRTQHEVFNSPCSFPIRHLALQNQNSAKFQAIYNAADPMGSEFPSREEAQAWVDRGKELAARMSRECPRVASVDYQADGSIPQGTRVF
ncbi:hypothetical protein [Actinoalloteichus sp. GBA129-24]|uniref:Uncharacterized protein n=2 Tax=Actinoalloteichus fjordicus TaxID=1612552 RepID=A0AAC9PTB8_9PSEU|nr:hypothetical protein [Actinoalloteichus sp. GBA129-24]APU15968.1 hypothetical protein UA74_19715 [Actinoalloteichus fjordicus]APU22032.1 hypothetical protein UA75_20215 [Actinoalloteichus sp. GBA129-24]